MTKAVIFDLDSCLSAADEPGRHLFDPAFAAIRHASNGSYSPEALEKAFEDMWRIPFDAVAKTHGFTSAMRDAGWAFFARLEITTPMRGYGDLDALNKIAAQRFLVTSGFRRLQESKVRALGITSLFAAVHIDAIDEPGHRGKQAIFEEILQLHALRPLDVVVVGDNPDSEIAAGNRLGIRTVQILRPGVPYSANASAHVNSLWQLVELLRTEIDPSAVTSDRRV
jgi:FMN phosphatase YigB (HAD superfamily)